MRWRVRCTGVVTLTMVMGAGQARAEAHGRCLPAFRQQRGERNGWMGADAAFSVPLPRGDDLWIFGDTLLGPQRTVQNGEPAMTHNSLALSHCESAGAGWSVQFAIPKDAQGTARSVFVPKEPEHWYWPMDGFVAGKLWVVLLCEREPKPPRPGAFNFESCGVDLASLPLGEDLEKARPAIQPLTPGSAEATMSSTAVVHGGFVYFFGVRETGDRALLLSRVRLSRLAHAARWIETLQTDGRWRRGAPTAGAKVMMQPGATEMSVRYHPEWRRWLAVYKDPSLSSDDVLLRSAPALTGPWSAARPLFRIRAVDPAAARPGTFCYAAKEHPEFARRGELAVTYVCNASDPAQLVVQDDLYLPQVVLVSLGKRLQVRSVERSARSTPDHSARSPGQAEGGAD